MQKFIVLLISFVFLAGCILPEDGSPPVQPQVPIETAPPIQDDVNLPQENRSTVGENQSAKNETITPSQPPEELAQKIEGSAGLDSSAGRYSTKRCNIKLSRSQIESGDIVWVKIYAYSPSNERVSFLCGESEKSQGCSGLFQDEIRCEFEKVGVTNVWLSLDGYICATAPLRVIDRDSRFDKFCQVVDYTNSDESTGVSRRFEASVYITNYDSNDYISWTCGEEAFEERVGELILAQEKTGYIRLTCDFLIDPGYINSIPVYVGDDYCGDLIS